MVRSSFVFFILGKQIYCYSDVNFPCHPLLVVGLVGFVVAVGHLPAAAVDAGHHPGRDALHHLLEHLLLAVQFLPGGDDGGSQLSLSLWFKSLNFVFEDSPDLEKE